MYRHHQDNIPLFQKSRSQSQVPRCLTQHARIHEGVDSERTRQHLPTALRRNRLVEHANSFHRSAHTTIRLLWCSRSNRDGFDRLVSTASRIRVSERKISNVDTSHGFPGQNTTSYGRQHCILYHGQHMGPYTSLVFDWHDQRC